MTTPTDYDKIFDAFPTIHGEPDYPQLKALKDNLKANATKIPSDLGGGGHGHLGAVLSNIEYPLVSPIPFVRPTHPGPLTIPAGITARAEQGLREDHARLEKRFHNFIMLENALKKKITDAIHEDYIGDLRDPTTKTILHDIPFILDHLFTRYGEVSTDELDDATDAAKKMQFSVTDPLTKLYTTIEDLDQLAQAANSPFLPTQLLRIAIRILKSTNDYTKGLSDWYERPVHEQTWPNFKTHFVQAKALLQKVRGKTMRDTSFQSANKLSEEIGNLKDEITELRSVQSTVLGSIEENKEVMNQVSTHIANTQPHDGRYGFIPPQFIHGSYHNENIPPEHQSANSSFTSGSGSQRMPPAYAKMINDMKAEIGTLKATLQQQQQYPPGPHYPPSQYNRAPRQNNGGGRDDRFPGRGRGGRNNASGGRGGRGQFQRTNTSRYCWTHGACGHDSSHCRFPAAGHRWEATFDNKLGGSLYYCPNARQGQ